jgi:hypothetical protein
MGTAVSRSEPNRLVRRGECRDFGDEGSEVALLVAGRRNRIRGFVIMPNSWWKCYMSDGSRTVL